MHSSPLWRGFGSAPADSLQVCSRLADVLLVVVHLCYRKAPALSMCAVQGNTVLVYACTLGRSEAVKFLLSEGAGTVFKTEKVGLQMHQHIACKLLITLTQAHLICADAGAYSYIGIAEVVGLPPDFLI